MYANKLIVVYDSVSGQANKIKLMKTFLPGWKDIWFGGMKG